MKRFTRVAMVGCALLLAACSDDPAAPQQQEQQRLFNASEGDDVTPLARYRFGVPDLGNGWSVKLIGPYGGSIALGGFRVDVPEGALLKPTLITIRVPLESLLTLRVWAEFGPHGQQFESPITLTLPYAGTTAEADSGMNVLWYDGQRWVRLPTTQTADGRIQTQTTHFSEYGTEEGETGKGITLGN